MKKQSTLNWMAILVACLPAGYLASIWNNLPQIVPVHFGMDMKPDRFGDKAELWLAVFVLMAVSIGTYFLLNNLHRIDPKRKDATQAGTFSKLAFGLVVFMAALNCIIITSAKGASAPLRLVFPLIGLLFAFIGNYMNNIKPNYFAGIRLPWTLSSDENWRKTHQLASKIWFAGGLLIAVISAFLPAAVVVPVFLGVIAILVIIPVVYSYRIYKQQTLAK